MHTYRLFAFPVLGLVSTAVLGCGSLNGSSLESRAAVAAALPDLDAITRPRDAITTSFSDVDTAVVLPDTFGTGSYASLRHLPRNADGSFEARPGMYQLAVRSYCLHAGTAGPSHGEGYLYGPLKGPRANMIGDILRRQRSASEIPQTRVQLLIWAILAHTKVTDLPPELQAAAAKLLTTRDIAELQTDELNVIAGDVLDRATAHLPASARSALATENRLRAKLTDASASYADVERLAVTRAGPPNGPFVPRGRWSRHPGGFYIRYLPVSYQRTVVQVYVPSGRVAHSGSGDDAGIDLVGDAAVPASTGSQRLATSNEDADGDGPSGAPEQAPVTPPPAEPPVVIGPPPKPADPPDPEDCSRPASSYGDLNYGVPNGVPGTYSGHDPNWDVYPGSRGHPGRDEPVFLNLRPEFSMGELDAMKGDPIVGTGNATLVNATVNNEPWPGIRPPPPNDPHEQYGAVVSVDAHYQYTREDGTTGELTFYIEYLHLISKDYPPVDSLGNPLPAPHCHHLGTGTTRGHPLSPQQIADDPLLGFEGATQHSHVHIQARVVDGVQNGIVRGPLIDPSIALYGNHGR